jgi:hypothetical protein
VKRTISFAIASASTAAATAAGLWLAVPAGAAVSGTEHFQAIGSATSSTRSLIASGVFTKGGIDRSGNKADTFVFSNGTFKVAHSKGTGKPTLNRKTCLLSGTFRGTIALSGGTGAYKGISGKGTYQFNELAILARIGGKCSMKKPPTASQVVIKATASVKL